MIFSLFLPLYMYMGRIDFDDTILASSKIKFLCNGFIATQKTVVFTLQHHRLLFSQYLWCCNTYC